MICATFSGLGAGKTYICKGRRKRLGTLARASLPWLGGPCTHCRHERLSKTARKDLGVVMKYAFKSRLGQGRGDGLGWTATTKTKPRSGSPAHVARPPTHCEGIGPRKVGQFAPKLHSQRFKHPVRVFRAAVWGLLGTLCLRPLHSDGLRQAARRDLSTASFSQAFLPIS